MRNKIVLFSMVMVAVAVAVFAVLAVPLVSAGADPIYISACSVLDTEGATYYLTADITNSGASICMDAQAANITLDCQGHTIDGIDNYRTIGVESSQYNTTVKNCVVTDWMIGISYYGAANGLIENNTLKSNMDYPIATEGSSNIIITGNTVTHNDKFGISIGSNSIVSNNIVNSNGATGIRVSKDKNNNIITGNTINFNGYGAYGGDGIWLGANSNNTVTDNTVNANTGSGIFLSFSGYHKIYNNKIENNGNYGIYTCEAGRNGPSTIYNNLLNNINNYGYDTTRTTPIYLNYWNTTRQAGKRIYSYGPEIGGNYWTNPSGTGYSDTCTDADKDGFCDDPYIVVTDNVDFLPLSDEIQMLDLTPTAITVPALFPNEPNAIGATINNIGTLDAGSFNVSLSADGTVVDKTRIDSLSAGASIDVSFVWTPASTDDHRLCVFADSDSEVDEGNEGNNELCEDVRVPVNLVYLVPEDSGAFYCCEAEVEIWVEAEDSFQGGQIKLTYTHCCANVTNVEFNTAVWPYTTWYSGDDGSEWITFRRDLPMVNGTVLIGTLTIHCCDEDICDTELHFIGKAEAVAEGHTRYCMLSDDRGNALLDVGWPDGTFSCGKPDLVITEKSEEWVSLKDGTFTVAYTVANIGDVNAGASTTTIYIDGVPEKEDSVPALAAGASCTNTVGLFTCPCGETLTIGVCADSDDVVDESDEGNNCLSNEWVCPVPAGVTFDKKRLDLNSNGTLKAFIILPEGYNATVADTNVSTVTCEEARVIGSKITGKGVLEAKFEIPDLREDLPTGDNVTMTVKGELYDGRPFEGSNTVEVVYSGKPPK